MKLGKENVVHFELYFLCLGLSPRTNTYLGMYPFDIHYTAMSTEANTDSV